MIANSDRSSSISLELPDRYGATRGTPESALATASHADERTLWSQAIDAMLTWKSNPDRFEPDDRPALAVLDAAIDFAVDQMESTPGTAAPSSVVPSGGGRIAFEWHGGRETLVLEFLRQGEARFTYFLGDRVEQRGRLVRNPRSRRLEREA